MVRVTTLLVIFFVGLNVFAAMLMSTGAAATLGITTDVGGDAELNNTLGQAGAGDNGGLPTGSPSDGTLFGLYNVVAGTIAGVFEYIFPGLQMLGRAGVPSFITSLLGTVFTLVMAFDVASFVRGYDL